MSGTSIVLECFDGVSAAAIHEPEATALLDAALADAEAARIAEEAAAAARQAALEAQERHHEVLVGRLRELQAAVTSRKQDAVHAVSAAVGEAVATLLPALADDAMPEEIAVGTARIIAAAGLPGAHLAVSAEDHERVVAALSALAPAGAVTVVAEPQLGPGDARLTWTDGGADFEASALIPAAEAGLNRRLQDLLRSTTDE